MRPAHLKEQRCKEIRKIRRRTRQIYKLKYDLGFRELEKPLRHGWIKEFTLTVQLDRYPRLQKNLLEVFNKLDQSFWGKTKAECDRKWNAQVSKHLIVNDRPSISKRSFNKLSEGAQRLCVPYQFREERKMRTRFYLKIPKPVCKIRYERAYITHAKIIDPQLESELDLLDHQLHKPGYYNLNHQGIKKYGRTNWKTPELKKKRKEQNRLLRQWNNTNASARSILEELWEKNSKGKI